MILSNSSENVLVEYILSHLVLERTSICTICSEFMIYLEKEFIIDACIELLGKQYSLYIRPDIVLVTSSKVEVIDIKSGQPHSDYIEQLLFYLYGISKVFNRTMYIGSIFSIKSNELISLLHYTQVSDLEKDFNSLVERVQDYLSLELNVTCIDEIIKKLDITNTATITKYNKCFICNLKSICPIQGNKDEFLNTVRLINETTRDIIVVTETETFILSSEKD